MKKRIANYVTLSLIYPDGILASLQLRHSAKDFTKHSLHLVPVNNLHSRPQRMTRIHTLNLKQFICKNCSHQCAYDCAQLCYTVQHRTVLIIFPLILQTVRWCLMEGRGYSRMRYCPRAEYVPTVNYCMYMCHVYVIKIPTTPELCSHHTSYGSLKSTRFSRRYLPTWIGAGIRPCSFLLGLQASLWRSCLYTTEK